LKTVIAEACFLASIDLIELPIYVFSWIASYPLNFELLVLPGSRVFNAMLRPFSNARSALGGLAGVTLPFLSLFIFSSCSE
jgi:hypothetical protein